MSGGGKGGTAACFVCVRVCVCVWHLGSKLRECVEVQREGLAVSEVPVEGIELGDCHGLEQAKDSAHLLAAVQRKGPTCYGS